MPAALQKAAVFGINCEPWVGQFLHKALSINVLQNNFRHGTA
jgi:hypothetical protein